MRRTGLILLAAACLLLATTVMRSLLSTDDIAESAAQGSPHDPYGVDTTLYQAREQRVRAGQTLETILSGAGVPLPVIYQAAQAAQTQGLFNPRALIAGDSYRTYQDTALTAPQLWIFHRSLPNYVIFDFRDSVAVVGGALPVSTRRRSAVGEIRSSLWQTLYDVGEKPAMAVKLEQLYAWQIDFHHLQPGDRFHIIYEEQVVRDSTWQFDIVAALFENAGKRNYAFLFEDGYYDEKGNTMRRAFLKAPVEYSRISSGFSLRRYHPIRKRVQPHYGTDYAAPTGTPIRTTADGVVINKGYTRGNGNYVRVKHARGYATTYLHMSRFKAGLRIGQRIKQGDVIGHVGSTGLANGPHVCYRLTRNGKPVNSRTIALPPAEPIAEERRAEFIAMADSVLPKLTLPESTP